MNTVESAIFALCSRAMGRESNFDTTLPAELGKARLVHLTLRKDGKRVKSLWVEGSDLATALSIALSGSDAQTVEISVAGPRAKLNPADFKRAASNRWRGLYGIELRLPDKRVWRIAPLEVLTRNLGPTRAVEKLAQDAGIEIEAATSLWQFRADEFLVDVASRRCTQLFRGQEIVPQTWITRENVASMANEMTDWLVRQVGSDGKTTYKYWPSSGEYSTSNNMIRQFMGSACLALAAKRHNGETAEAAKKNFSYNFKNFYIDLPQYGVINEDGKIKLGAAGVAMQAILNLQDHAPYVRHLNRLRSFVEHMQNADGSFRTFLEPRWRTDCENFYPGEAMLGLAMLDKISPDPAIIERLMRGFHFYRDWHLKNRNPAFVPWHTQALCLLHSVNGASEVADFIFLMNDWLLGMQQGPEAPEDVRGEFFDPKRPQYGPPHASATGVYMEGLAEAFLLARRLGDTRRAEAYRKSLLRAARSLRQMQYSTPLSMFYLHRKERVRGAIRTSSFDNTVRIDNVQHGLMALYKMLDHFTEADFIH